MTSRPLCRINIKIGGNDASDDREKLMQVCLNSSEQCLPVGWSYVYEEENIGSYQDYYNAVKSRSKRINPVHNIFRDSQIDDLFWTRDLDGYYWICRTVDTPKHVLDSYQRSLDIGAILPVKAYRYGLQVPGQIKAAFNRANGGTAQRIRVKLGSEKVALDQDGNKKTKKQMTDDEIERQNKLRREEDRRTEALIEFSKLAWNSGFENDKNILKEDKIKAFDLNLDSFVDGKNLLDNLPDFDLEELVISYLQIQLGYYVFSNSIANKSTTPMIECELGSRNPQQPGKAVVQVKGGHSSEIDALMYVNYIEDGYTVYLVAPMIKHFDEIERRYPEAIVEITRDDLNSFYKEYKSILPSSITQWENLFSQ